MLSKDIELTLTSQCLEEKELTVDFSNNPFANLSDPKQHMEFVMKAAVLLEQFSNSEQISQSLQEIASGRGLQ